MLDIALYEPEIPPNTGNIVRLCANTGARLHLIHPLGFSLEDKLLRRAGLDYRDLADVEEYGSLEALLERPGFRRIFAITTKGTTHHTDIRYEPGDLLLFGPESRGLPAHVLDRIPAQDRVRIPMRQGVRSLNLANAVAIVVYEAWRQQGFPGSA